MREIAIPRPDDEEPTMPRQSRKPQNFWINYVLISVAVAAVAFCFSLSCYAQAEGRYGVGCNTAGSVSGQTYGPKSGVD